MNCQLGKLSYMHNVVMLAINYNFDLHLLHSKISVNEDTYVLHYIHVQMTLCYNTLIELCIIAIGNQASRDYE